MERVRTYLNPIRAEQLKQIAEHHGFDSIATYLDSHISQEWQKLLPKNTPSQLPGFKISSELFGNERIVSFSATGKAPIRMSAFEAGQFGRGIERVVNDNQRTFFIGSTVDESILFFGKQGTGYQFIIKGTANSDNKFALSDSIARDLSEIFKYQSTH